MVMSLSENTEPYWYSKCFSWLSSIIFSFWDFFFLSGQIWAGLNFAYMTSELSKESIRVGNVCQLHQDIKPLLTCSSCMFQLGVFLGVTVYPVHVRSPWWPDHKQVFVHLQHWRRLAWLCWLTCIHPANKAQVRFLLLWYLIVHFSPP